MHKRPRHAGQKAQASGATPQGPAEPDLDHEMNSGEWSVSPQGVLSATGALESHEGLNAKVLVLNKAFAATRIVSAKRAFCLLARNIAEVIHVENDTVDGATVGGRYVNYDFESWLELSVLQHEIERERHDWVTTVRMEIAVPRIIRLLGYDRLPEQGVKLNRRNLFARDRNRCQYCGRIFP
ncbi:MAG: HNH endonuclease, partial [Phycisphaerae bacterium]